MNIVYLMVPIALLVAGSFIGLFVWASRTGQWDDLDVAPIKAMLDLKPRGQNAHAASETNVQFTEEKEGHGTK